MADDIPSRVAVLEQIARDTAAALTDIRADLREFRTEMRSDFGQLRDAQGQTGRRVAMLTGVTSLLGVAVIGILISQGMLWQQMGRLDGQLSAIGAQVTEIATTLHQHGG
jgi:hypothetical protein